MDPSEVASLRSSLASQTFAEARDKLAGRVADGSASETDLLNWRLLNADLTCRSRERPEPAPSRNPIRIAVASLLFNWPSTGGGIIHTAELAKFLSLSDFEVCHFYAKHEPWAIGHVEGRLPYASEPLEFSSDAWNAHEIRGRFREAVTRYAPDCVIVTDSWNSKLLLAEAVNEFPYFLRLAAMECLCPLNNVRLLLNSQGQPQQCRLTQFSDRPACVSCIETQSNSSGSLHRRERRLAGFERDDYGERLSGAFSQARAVLAVNRQVATLVEPYASDVRVIPSGFDEQRFVGLPKRAFGDKPFRLLFAGLTQEFMKGFHVLLEACRHLWRSRQDFELWVTDSHCQHSDPFLRCCGWQDQSQLPHTMAQCDAVVVPTIAQEALGRTAVEAMGAGRAVIASRLGGLPETVCEGLTGLLVDPADGYQLGEAINTLVESPAITARMGSNGRQRFAALFPWDVIIEKHYRPLFEACRVLR
ncbi:MAG: glycosyltransferase family 4 protein [Candidatus Paceibacterota bacterium]